MRYGLSMAILTASLSLAADRITLTGKVTDSLGKPLAGATVMVYHAGVKKGYSTYCPSCYVDCGKRSVTDKAGSFTIKSLAPGLWFELLVIHDGYTAAFVEKVDPSRGPAATAALTRRVPVEDSARVVRGRVVDTHGRPMPAAVVQTEGVVTADGGTLGTIPGLEPLAATNLKGEFELAYSKPAVGMVLRVEARGMAPKLIAAPTGKAPSTITVSDGAAIRGRLVNHGKPVAGAEVGLIPRARGGYTKKLEIYGTPPYGEVRIGTLEDGSFVIPNVPAPVEWFVYGKMESIAALGATGPVECATVRDGEEVNVGDLEIQRGYHLAGKVMLMDGGTLSEGMRITILAERTFDSQTVSIGRDGYFEFVGLPKGASKILTSVKGYHLHANKDTVSINRDVDDFIINLDPDGR